MACHRRGGGVIDETLCVEGRSSLRQAIPKLKRRRDFRDEEIAIATRGVAHGAKDRPGYRFRSEAIEAGCRVPSAFRKYEPPLMSEDRNGVGRRSKIPAGHDGRKQRLARLFADALHHRSGVDGSRAPVRAGRAR